MFYDNYVKLCNSIGKSPSAVAVEVGIYKSTVSNWKNRGTSPTDATAQRIADYFGVSVEELCGGQKEKHSTEGEVLKPLTQDQYKVFLESLSMEELLALNAEMAEAIQRRLNK